MIEQVSSFKDRLNEALRIRNIKPVELSEKTGISESTISQYRSGYAKPKEPRLGIIANALYVNPAWLMGLNVPMEIIKTYNTVEEFVVDQQNIRDSHSEGTGEQLVIKVMQNTDLRKRLIHYAKFLLSEKSEDK